MKIECLNCGSIWENDTESKLSMDLIECPMCWDKELRKIMKEEEKQDEKT